MTGAMRAGERLRVRLLFGMLGAVPVFLTGWLAWLQIAQRGELRRDGDLPPLRLQAGAADRQRERRETVPGPRGTVVDRNGTVLAIDCEVYEVRADIRPPAQKRVSTEVFRGWLDELANGFADALTHDPMLADRQATRAHLFARLQARLQRAFAVDELPATGPVPDAAAKPRNVLVAADVDVLADIEALRAFDDQRSSVVLQWQRGHKRVYPEHELTCGLVGFVEDLPVALATPAHPHAVAYETFGRVGMESLAVLEPVPGGERRFFRDSVARPYFAAPASPVPPPNVLQTTLDLELQKIATRELDDGARAGASSKGNLPQWGALVLVEIETGDVLAAASWLRDVKNPKGAMFTPLQSLYEPGSIVKPLVFGFALEKGGLDWNDEFDCTSSGAGHERLVEETGRVVHDDHACGRLSPHGILVNSSNIGAVKVGSLLGREQWRDYMAFYGFGRTLGWRLPHEQRGGFGEHSFDPTIPLKSFRKFTGSSFSFGYELKVNALQIARAYLSLLSGRSRELRLYRAVESGGERAEVTVPAASGTRLSAASVDLIRDAMVDVVSDEAHATGFQFHKKMLAETGIDLHGLVAGKTGTAVSHSIVPGRGRVEVRNASFVGYAPADAPRFLAVCVLQKDDNARFYGGSYAAPPVARLLLQAMRLQEQRRERQEPQVSASPGDSGQGGIALETTRAGR